jgi:hypothetical protein
METFGRACVLYFCSAFGGFATTLGDMVLKGEASAVRKLTRIAGQDLALAIDHIWSLLFFVVVAIFLCLVYQPKSRKEAFMVGAGAIALFMTATPYSQAPGGQPSTLVAERTVADFTGVFMLVANNDALPRTKILRISLRNPSRGPQTAVVRVYNKISGEEFLQKNIIGILSKTDFSFQFNNVEDRQYAIYEIEINGKLVDRKEISFEGSEEIGPLFFHNVPAEENNSLFEKLKNAINRSSRF